MTKEAIIREMAEVKSKMDEIYHPVQDFTVDSVETDKAIDRLKPLSKRYYDLRRLLRYPHLQTKE